MKEEGIMVILKVMNYCWESESMPEEFELAEVVTLYKKGNVEDPSNYRPISLLQALYKLYAALIKNRLADKLEEKIWKTQYGFRKAKSTEQPLYITRRLQDYAEESNESLVLLFLDWEKAFDKVDQVELIEAINGLNIPEK